MNKMNLLMPRLLNGTALSFAFVALSATGALAQSTRVVSATEKPTAHPTISVPVSGGDKMVGGGAFVDWHGAGSLLTTTAPLNATTWTASAKDHAIPDPSAITAYAVALTDPANEWDVITQEVTGAVAQHPTATVSVPQGYVMTGGGCRVNWKTSAGAPGNLLTASFPSSPTTWECRAKDHSYVNLASITAYVTAIRPRNPGTPMPRVHIDQAASASIQHPDVSVNPSNPAWVVTGGGGRVDASYAPGNAPGQLLTMSAPRLGGRFGNKITGWNARAKDHLTASPGPVTAFVVSLEFGAAVPPPPPEHGNFYIQVDRITANRQTSDTALNTDGWGDEIFLTAEVRDVKRTGQSIPDQTVGTYVYGDLTALTKGTVYVRGGRGDTGLIPTTQGGLVSGDTIPGPGNYACSNGDSMHLCLPMRIWAGQLTAGEDGIVIVPQVFEYDPPDPVTSLALDWLQFQASSSQEVSDSGIFNSIFGGVAKPWIEITRVGTPHAQQILNNVLGVPATRPIGLRKNAAGQYELHGAKIGLTYESAMELVNSTSQVGNLAPGHFTIRYQDDDRLRGDYTVEFSIHREP